MAKRGLQGRLKEGLSELSHLVQNAHDETANAIFDAAVSRYGESVVQFLAKMDVLDHPLCSNWVRLLQVRFLQIACEQRPSVRDAVGRLLTDGSRPEPKELMREVMRWCIIETMDWGRKHKGTPLASKGPPGPQVYFQRAIDSVTDDMEKELKAGKTISDAPQEWFAILGADYSCRAVPPVSAWMSRNFWP